MRREMSKTTAIQALNDAAELTERAEDVGIYAPPDLVDTLVSLAMFFESMINETITVP